MDVKTEDSDKLNEYRRSLEIAYKNKEIELENDYKELEKKLEIELKAKENLLIKLDHKIQREEKTLIEKETEYVRKAEERKKKIFENFTKKSVEGLDLFKELIILLRKSNVADRANMLQSLAKDLSNVGPFGEPEFVGIPMSREKGNYNLVFHFVRLGCPKEFFDAIETQTLMKMISKIKILTGFSPVASQKSSETLYQLTFKSPNRVEIPFLNSEEEAAIKEALKEDLAHALLIPADKIKIERVISSGLEIIISTTNKTSGNKEIDSKNFPRFTKSQKYFVEFTASLREILPEKDRALELIKAFSAPLTIDLKTVNLPDWFSQTLETLLLLSKQVKIKADGGKKQIKVFGTPLARNRVQYCLMEIGNLLVGRERKITISEPLFDSAIGSLELWNVLFLSAKKFALQDIGPEHELQTFSLRMNPNLESGSPSASSFVNGLKVLGFDISSPSRILDAGVFAWHGVETKEELLNCAISNLQTNLNAWILFGEGKYFSKTSAFAHPNSGETNSLAVFFIIKQNNKDFIEIENNELYRLTESKDFAPDSVFCVPILFATFNKQQVLDIGKSKNKGPCDGESKNKGPCDGESKNKGPCDGESKNKEPCDNNKFIWQWSNHNNWESYGVGQSDQNLIQTQIESKYQIYLGDNSQTSLNLDLIRLNDKEIGRYNISFSLMKQVNLKTNYERNIRRIKDE